MLHCITLWFHVTWCSLNDEEKCPYIFWNYYFFFLKWESIRTLRSSKYSISWLITEIQTKPMLCALVAKAFSKVFDGLNAAAGKKHRNTFECVGPVPFFDNNSGLLKCPNGNACLYSWMLLLWLLVVKGDHEDGIFFQRHGQCAVQKATDKPRASLREGTLK